MTNTERRRERQLSQAVKPASDIIGRSIQVHFLIEELRAKQERFWSPWRAVKIWCLQQHDRQLTKRLSEAAREFKMPKREP